jgi:hypothetical protein
MAALMRAIADTLLEAPAAVTGLPPEAIQTFVEGTTTGSVAAGKAKGRKRKVSAYNKAFSKAFKRQKAKMTKKNGDWKKGCNSSKCMKAAHKETKRSLK